MSLRPTIRDPDTGAPLGTLPVDSKSELGEVSFAATTGTLRFQDGVLELWPKDDGFDSNDREWQDTFDKLASEGGADDPTVSDYPSEKSFLIRRRRIGGMVQPRGEVILDVGCGPGLFSAPWAKDNHVVGLDGSRSMCRAAAQNGLVAIRAPAFSLPFEDASFDGAVLIEVLQIVSDPDAVLAELARVVRPGGWLLMSTHNAKSLVRQFIYRFLHRGAPHQMFDEASLCQRLRSLGFSSFDVQHIYLPFDLASRTGIGPAGYVATTLALLARKPG